MTDSKTAQMLLNSLHLSQGFEGLVIEHDDIFQTCRIDDANQSFACVVDAVALDVTGLGDEVSIVDRLLEALRNVPAMPETVVLHRYVHSDKPRLQAIAIDPSRAFSTHKIVAGASAFETHINRVSHNY